MSVLFFSLLNTRYYLNPSKIMSKSIIGQDHFQNHLRDLMWNHELILTKHREIFRVDEWITWKKILCPTTRFLLWWKSWNTLLFLNLEGARHSFNDANFLVFKPKLVLINLQKILGFVFVLWTYCKKTKQKQQQQKNRHCCSFLSFFCLSMT